MKQPYLFEFDNLGFRPVIENDFDHLVLLNTDPELRPFCPNPTLSENEIKEKILQYKKDYHEKGYSAFLVFELDTGEFIGQGGFHDDESMNETEIGYALLKKYWGKGYATRIVKALLIWAKSNLAKEVIIAVTACNHPASERVMQKAGMVFSRWEKINGLDCVIYEYKF